MFEIVSNNTFPFSYSEKSDDSEFGTDKIIRFNCFFFTSDYSDNFFYYLSTILYHFFMHAIVLLLSNAFIRSSEKLIHAHIAILIPLKTLNYKSTNARWTGGQSNL